MNVFKGVKFEGKWNDNPLSANVATMEVTEIRNACQLLCVCVCVCVRVWYVCVCVCVYKCRVCLFFCTFPEMCFFLSLFQPFPDFYTSVGTLNTGTHMQSKLNGKHSYTSVQLWLLHGLSQRLRSPRVPHVSQTHTRHIQAPALHAHLCHVFPHWLTGNK
jgi:hypothetical protein